MPGKFHFELISPSEKLVAEDVTMVTVPGTEGDFGVLAGHSPLLSSLRPGVINIYRNNMTDVSQSFTVQGGFADVGQNHCTILAEDAADVTRAA